MTLNSVEYTSCLSSGLLSVSKGFNMNGKIYPDTRSKCVKCGSAKFDKREMVLGFQISICECGGDPSRFRLRSYYVDPNKKSGRSRAGDIRYTDTGERITDRNTAIYMLKQIEKEIELGIFKPDKYVSLKNRNKYKVKSLLAKYVLWNWRRVGYEEERIGRRTAFLKLSTAKRHLRPHFGDIDVQLIPKDELVKRFRKVESNKRKVHEELTSFFKYLKSELGIISELPKFPPKPVKRFRDADEIPDIHALEKIVKFMEIPQCRVAAKLCGLYLCRPSDVLTLKGASVDITRCVLKLDSHDSMGREEPGRKSDRLKRGTSHTTLPINEEFFKIIEEVGLPEGEEYLLKSAQDGDDYLSYSTLNNDWNKAREKAAKAHSDPRLAEAQLYTSAKHAGVTRMVEMGIPTERIMRITGVSREALEHYARLKAESVMGDILRLNNLRKECV